MIKNIILSIFIFSIQLLADNININLTETEKKWIKNNTITIGVSPWKPISYIHQQTNTIDGISIDILKLVIKKANLKVKVINSNWATLLSDFKKHKVDILPAVYYTKERATYGLYSQAILKLNEYLYIKSKSKIKDFIHLKNKKLAIIKSYGTIPKIKAKFPTIQIVQTKNLDESIKFVLDGTVDALYDTQFVVEDFISTNSIIGLKYIKQKEFEASPIFFFSNKQKPILHSILQKSLDSIAKNEKDKIIFRWVGLEEQKQSILSQDEITYLKDNIFTVTTTTDWAPFNYKNENLDIKGMGIDYWNLISQKVGIKSKTIESNSFKEVLSKIQNKEYDLNIATTKTIDKKEYSIFSNPYEKFPIAIATLDTDYLTSNASLLEHKKVAVGKNYSAYFILKSKYKNIDFIFTNNTKEALQLVEDKKVFAAVDIEPSLYHQILTNNFKNVKISGFSDMDFNLQIMLRDDYFKLQTIINKAINLITVDEKIALYKKWMNKKQKYIIDYTLIWQIVGIFFIILAIIFIAYIKQKRLEREIKLLNMTLEKKVKAEIAKSRKKDKMMLQQSRLAQMGEMINMIAHQWRQPLGSINSIIINMQLKSKDNYFENDFQDINKYVKHLSLTIDDFSNFYQPNKKKELISINILIVSALDIIGKSLNSKNITIKTNFETNKKIYLYKNELIQVILVIIQNSIDNFQVKNIENPQIMLNTKENNNRYYITVIDNGGGIDTNIIDNIFDPYFSTKNKKNNTGLGLYMSKMIIQEHNNGNLSVKNIKDGVCFSMEFVI